MALNHVAFVAVLASLTSLPMSYADGAGSGGGGDPCKNEIDRHRVAIQGWIARDEATGLDFSKALVSGWNDDSYKQSMLKYLEPGKVVVTCYLDPARINDPDALRLAEKENLGFKAIAVGDPPKPVTCNNYEDKDGVSHIDCDFDRVMASVGNPDFVLTHHEFASIAGIERRTGGYISDLSISNQLSDHEHWEQVKVLGPIGEGDTECSDIYQEIKATIDNGIGEYKYNNNDYEFAWGHLLDLATNLDEALCALKLKDILKLCTILGSFPDAEQKLFKSPALSSLALGVYITKINVPGKGYLGISTTPGFCGRSGPGYVQQGDVKALQEAIFRSRDGILAILELRGHSKKSLSDRP